MTIHDAEERVRKAIEMIEQYGGYDGGHHKQWVLDQVLRVLLADEYEAWVAAYEHGGDGAHTYEWETGMAP